MARIIFMGTPDFAEKSLRKLNEGSHEVVAVVTNPDRPKGRGLKMIASPVKVYALQENMAIYQPEKVRGNETFIEQMRSLHPDFICVVAYGKILPKEILEIPRYGCINVHGSLLPQYRGAAPIQWAVLNGDTKTGVTTMYMDTKMDTGDMILKKEVTIGPEETTGELWNRLATIGADLLIETLQQIEEGTAPRIPQTGNFSMAPLLTKSMAKIDWKMDDAQKIHNLIRGLNPIMGAYTNYQGKKIKFWKAQIVPQDTKQDRKKVEPGTILEADAKKGLWIATRDGILSILEIQGENAKRMPIADFLRGNQMQKGEIFA